MKFLRRYWWVLLVVFLIGAGIFVFNRVRAQGAQKTTTIQQGEVKQELVLSGEVKAVEHASLSFLSGGRLSYLGVKVGDEVKKGQLLASLDLTELRTAVIAAENAYLAADVAAKKAEDEVKGHAADETFAQKNTRVAAQTARDTAYFKLQAARIALQNGQIRAPFAGVVTQISDPFAGVNTQVTSFTIELLNPATVYFALTADQVEVSDLTVGQAVAIRFDSFDDTQYQGKIQEIGLTPLANASGTVYEVKVELTDRPENLRLGMTGDADLVIAQRTNVLFVPLQYLGSDDKGDYLKVDQSGTRRYVTIGIEGEDRVEVEGEGLREGMIIYD